MTDDNRDRLKIAIRELVDVWRMKRGLEWDHPETRGLRSRLASALVDIQMLTRAEGSEADGDEERDDSEVAQVAADAAAAAEDEVSDRYPSNSGWGRR